MRLVPTVFSRDLWIGIAVAAIFFYSAGFGLGTQLGFDDVMNITFAWEPPLKDLIVALGVPFASIYRPTGSAVYRVLFACFGLDPLPYRVFVYLVLLLNVYLIYRLAQRLSSSREIAITSALLYTYHGRLSAIYLNNGTLYDIVCATLVIILLTYYDGVRREDRTPNFREWATILLLFTAAINAKEMAASVPLLLFTYEVIYWRGGPTPAASATRFLRNCLPALACGVLTVLAARAKIGDASVMHGNPAYAMTFTVAHFIEHWRLLMTELVYAKGRGLNVAQMFAIWGALIAAAAAIRRKYLWFFLCFALLAPLPVIFIPFRGFFVMYLPLAGWDVAVAALLVELSNWLCTRRRARHIATLAKGFPLLAAMALVTWIPRHDSPSRARLIDPSQRIISATTDDILDLAEPLPRGARLLFLHDRYPAADFWGPSMICRLLYRDRDIWADRISVMTHPPKESVYDRVFDYNGRGELVVRARGAATGAPTFKPRRPLRGADGVIFPGPIARG